jgi:hypothetical protein
MSNLAKFAEIKRHIDKANKLLVELIEATPKAPGDRPPAPGIYQRVDHILWSLWDSFPKKPFTVAQLKQALVAHEPYLRSRTNASFTTALQRWKRAGFIRIVQQGVGRTPTAYAKNKPETNTNTQ